LTDADLYARGIRTLLTSWELYARGAKGAEVIRCPGGSAAVFPNGPERRLYNNAVLERDLTSAQRAEAVTAIEAAYAAAEVDRFAAWVHESDKAMHADLERRGYALNESTRAMGLMLDDISVPRVEIDRAPAEWEEHLRILGLPPGLLGGIDHSAFHLLVASLDNKNVATAMALDHEDDCGIYNVATLKHARRRGMATALSALHLREALARGCRTASLQATAAAESIYASLGFRDLGRLLEYEPTALTVEPLTSSETTIRSSQTPTHP
jgi:ribosomal protein S18 acetylase RimI-like enzyme